MRSSWALGVILVSTWALWSTHRLHAEPPQTQPSTADAAGESIADAIADHHLAPGMTMDQAKAAMVWEYDLVLPQTDRFAKIQSQPGEKVHRVVKPKPELVARDEGSQTYQWTFNRVGPYGPETMFVWRGIFQNGKVVSCSKS